MLPLHSQDWNPIADTRVSCESTASHGCPECSADMPMYKEAWQQRTQMKSCSLDSQEAPRMTKAKLALRTNHYCPVDERGREWPPTSSAVSRLKKWRWLADSFDRSYVPVGRQTGPQRARRMASRNAVSVRCARDWQMWTRKLVVGTCSSLLTIKTAK